jgi:hypothetical protein
MNKNRTFVSRQIWGFDKNKSMYLAVMGQNSSTPVKAEQGNNGGFSP